ncbi:MAG: O-antigen ligase family protein, partial [Vicinamibacterales bacterium]
ILYIPNAADSGFPNGLMPALIPLAIGLAWIFPVEMALIFVAFTMFRLHEAYPFLEPARLPILTAQVAILGAALHMAARNTVMPWQPELKICLLFGAHVTLGLVFSVDRASSMDLWTSNFGKLLAGTLFLAMLLKLPRDATRVALILIISSALISCVAIYNQLNGIDLVEGSRVTIGAEAKSLLGDPNDLCFVLMFPVAFALCGISVRGMPPMVRWICIVALPLMVWAIIATKSRGGVLATMVVVGYIYSTLRKTKVMPLVIAGACGGLLYSVAGIGDRGLVYNQNEVIDASSQGRVEAWKAAVRMAFVYALFGVGMGNFTALYREYSTFWDGRVYATHSIWFQVLAETGFVGLGLFVAMFVVAMRSASRSYHVLTEHDAPAPVRALSLAVTASWGGVCVAGSFLSQAYSWQIFLLVALTAALSQHVQDTYKSSAGAKPGESTTKPATAEQVA